MFFIKLFTLLYADDTIVLAETESDMKLALKGVEDYCNAWHMSVNTSKSKIVIFSKGKVRKVPTFHLAGKIVNVVDEYNYLGVTFNYNNKFTKAKCKQVNSARKTLYSLLTKSYNLNLPLDLLLQLFDQIVIPVLLYGCETWGYEDVKQLEAFHLNFCKQIYKG